ncbi:3-hydroxybutyrate dehydrogenase [Candidatus Berkiella aquae]|uniref:3-hydroxybutyrate dehydrogenase n=1 Tax=Candidatus Berkiella aquae TaxID=295108 RepID=A0A0Q9YLM3_9GAMM|nr:3-hydroxybutyrate dehydrogenase [Candidatus Berkiella aquae]MCS5711589.1 3-hydroxybutyrate dehydrogenase [Candidatus Berkiella aquae]
MVLKSKSAIITGSTSGIGLGIAHALAKEGVNVVINGFGQRDEIEDERLELEKTYQVKAIYSQADISKPQEIREMVKTAEKAFDVVDILVNNAGIQHVQPIDEFPDEKWDAIMAINLSSNFHAIKACVPGMKKRKWGRIINVSSVHGVIASPYKAAYVSAKHGVVGLTKVAALDLAPFGITANAICPGYVDTPLVRKQIPAQAKEYKISESEVIEKVLLKDQFIKEFVNVQDLGAMTVFLCSDAARMLTGQALCIDGGWTAH